MHTRRLHDIGGIGGHGDGGYGRDFPAAAFAVRMTGALLDSGDGTLRQQSMQQLRELVAGGAAGHEVVAWFDGLPSARQQLWPATIDQEAALLPKLHKVLSDENHFQVRHIHIIILHVDNTQTWQHCALCADQAAALSSLHMTALVKHAPSGDVRQERQWGNFERRARKPVAFPVRYWARTRALKQGVDVFYEDRKCAM